MKKIRIPADKITIYLLTTLLATVIGFHYLSVEYGQVNQAWILSFTIGTLTYFITDIRLNLFEESSDNTVQFARSTVLAFFALIFTIAAYGESIEASVAKGVAAIIITYSLVGMAIDLIYKKHYEPQNLRDGRI